MEPVPVTGIFPILQDILKSPEAPSHMIKYSVQYNPDPSCMHLLTHPGKILVGSQPAVNLFIIPCIITMGIRLKNRGKINRIGPQLLNMGDPVHDLQDPGVLLPVIFKWRPAESQRINLIKYTFICPHLYVLLASFYLGPSFTFDPYSFIILQTAFFYKGRASVSHRFTQIKRPAGKNKSSLTPGGKAIPNLSINN